MREYDKNIIRGLAEQYKEHCESERNYELRKLWTAHNDMQRTRPLVLVGMAMYNQMYARIEEDPVVNWIAGSKLCCTDPVAREIEKALRWKLYHISLEDDSIFEPYLLYPSVRTPSDEGRWGGIKCSLGEKVVNGGASAYNPSIFEEADIEKIFVADHQVDNTATQLLGEQYSDFLGDSLPVYADTRPALFRWTGDVSTDFAKMVGLENMFYLFYDDPELLHSLLKKMRDAILKNNAQWEAARDCCSSAGFNQCMPYSSQTLSPDDNRVCNRNQLWGFFAAQEFTSVSGEMYEEFCLNYQLPIMEQFGLIAYGCCEDLTNKIDQLRRVKNLRRISISPFAKVDSCAEQIGQDYVISYRPNPADMVSFGVDEDLVRSLLKKPLEIFRSNNSYFDIDLKDIQTVNKSEKTLADWVRVTKTLVSETF